MAIKKQPTNKDGQQYFMGVGSVKVIGDGVVIEGYANRKTIDRGNELIAADAWDLENYKKNPVILYNHGFDPNLGSTPIGKAVEVTPSEDGLRIRAVLSKLNDPMINRIRGLVEEKILRAFSVGFNPTDSNTDAKTGLKTITKAELFEVSIVGVPMNQDSLFELTSKMLKTKSIDKVKGEILTLKGSWVAAAIHNKIYELQKAGKDRDELIQAVADKAAISSEEMYDVLAGDVTPVPEPVLAAVSEILGLKVDDLKKLDAGDKEVEDATSDKEDQGAGKEDEPGQGDKEPQAQGEAQIVISTDGSKEKSGAANEGTNQADVKGTDFQQCVTDKISKLIKEGKEQDQAVAIAISHCSEGGKCTTPLTKKDYVVLFKHADDEATKFKQAGQGVDVPPVTTEITVEKTEAAQDDFGSPFLEAAKQTNVLLGAVINELQMMSKKLEGLAGIQSTPVAETPPPAEAPTAKAEDAAPPETTAPAPTDKPVESDGTPKEGMGEDELKAAQETRSKKFGIEVVDGAALVFAADAPTELSKYGDPVNLKYLIDTADTATKSRDEFKKSADDYKQDDSKAKVHSRIVEAQLDLGVSPPYDEKDKLDALLSSDVKDKLSKSKAKSLDSYRQRLENVKIRLANLGG